MLQDQFYSLFFCDRQKFNLTCGFLIFLFMVTGRGIIFICSASEGSFSPFISPFTRAAARLLVTHFQSCLPFSLAYPADEFSFKEMRTWCQSKFTSYCICVWCESGVGGRRSSRFPCVIPVTETSKDRVAKHQGRSSSA